MTPRPASITHFQSKAKKGVLAGTGYFNLAGADYLGLRMRQSFNGTDYLNPAAGISDFYLSSTLTN